MILSRLIQFSVIVIASLVLLISVQFDTSYAGNLSDFVDENRKNFSNKSDEARQRKLERSRKGNFSHLTISSGPDISYPGRCKGYKDISDHQIKLSNGNYGSIFVSCNNNCWYVSIHSTSFGTIISGATKCGNFDELGWVSAGGRLKKHNVSLLDVANFILQSN